MLSVKPFSQRNPRWISDQHGTSGQTIGSTGCTISLVASMLVHAGYDTDPEVLNETLTNNNGYAQGNLIIWTAIERLFPEVKWVERYYYYDNELAKEWINQGLMPLIEVSAAPIGGAPGGKHWVGFVGDYKSVDPWTGEIVDTSTWQPTGMALYEYVPGSANKGGTPMPPKDGGLPDNYPQIIHKATQWDETVAAYKINAKPEQATVEDLLSKTANAEKKSYDNGYRAGERKVASAYADERRRLEIYDEIIFPEGDVPRKMDELDVFDALEEFVLEREKIKRDRKSNTAAKESVKEPLRYVVGLVIGGLITYVYSQFPLLGQMGIEQQAITTSLIALVVRGIDKYAHTKDSSKGIDQSIRSLTESMLKND